MKTNTPPKKTKKIPFLVLGIILLLLFAITFLWLGNHSSMQAETPLVADVSFVGDYKIGDGEWQPIVAGEHISSTKGDVTLRGTFQMHNPTNGEVVGPLPANTTVNLYFNHIGGTAFFSEGYRIPFDVENNSFGEDACAVMWATMPSTGDTPVTIVLHNPHIFGNENAIDDFFENMSIAPGVYHETMMLEQGENQRNVGLLVLIASLIILGIAAFSSIIHMKYSKETWLIGLMSFFAGGYLSFDSFGVSIWNDSNILNTRMLGICMMFYMLFATSLIVRLLKNKIKKMALIANLISAATIPLCICLSFFTKIYFFDTWLLWATVEALVVLFLILCQILSFRNSTLTEKYIHIIAIVTLSAFLVDFVATGRGWWEGGLVSKFVFFAVFIIALVVVLRVIPSHTNAAIRARELEAEQQALKLELQESRISIMLSQMRPHFIFNTLNTIYHLCEINPEKARSTIRSFSEYLRNNIDNLGQSEMISFEKELSFVKTYLDIEKVRFDDELCIVFDIAVSNFKLPVLTVQPIVENAVKHGTSKKEGAATLYISTRELDSAYEIEIRDTGVGFDADKEHTDGHTHVGISSVRQRLLNLCGGTLTIQSVRGEGTTATIKIPKKEAFPQ